MDVDKKAEDSQQDDKAPDESCESQTPPAESSLKRKIDDADSDDTQNDKKVKVDKDEEGGAGEGEEGSKEDAAEEGEMDKDVKSEEKQVPSAEEEGKTEGDADDKEDTKAAEPSKQDEEMEVEESTEKDMPSGKVDNPQRPDTEEKTETTETREQGEETEQCTTDKSEPDQKSESEKEEKSEVTQRRYPTRNRKSDEKGAQSARANGPPSEEKKQGNPGINKDEISQESENSRAASVKSDSGSDKENMNSDAAIDTSNAGTPDVIMLSDEEQTEQSREKKAQKRKMVRRLQAHLRNEEAKLVLLKKLRQSQLAPQVQDHAPMTNSGNNQLTKQSVPRQQGGPPPLVRGNQQVRGSNLHMQQQNRTPNQGQMRNMQGPPPLVVTPRMGGNSSSSNGHSSSQNLRNNNTHLNQHSSSNHRPVQQTPSTQHQQQTGQQHQQASTPPQPPVDTQTPAQRQAAAKLALRKQLEKTLLQIPPPKPPAPEMNFIPSLACPDFVLLLGLEEVVNHIIDLQLIARGQKSPDEKFICNPFTCVQCGTDYTPVWKREKPGSKNVICEHCVTWNQKRALKQEHTNRLKSAFVKALQQEQEIERMQAQTPSNPSTPTPSVTPPTSASSSAPPQALAAAAAASNVAAAAAMSMSPASFRPSAEQVRQHHTFLQAQAQLRAGQSLPSLQGFGARSPFPYNLPYVKQADLQRQYLLDMIPRAAGMPWKQ